MKWSLFPWEVVWVLKGNRLGSRLCCLQLRDAIKDLIVAALRSVAKLEQAAIAAAPAANAVGPADVG